MPPPIHSQLKNFLFGKLDNGQLAHSDRTLKKLNYCLVFVAKKKQIDFDEFKQKIAFKFHIEGFT